MGVTEEKTELIFAQKRERRGQLEAWTYVTV